MWNTLQSFAAVVQKSSWTEMEELELGYQSEVKGFRRGFSIIVSWKCSWNNARSGCRWLAWMPQTKLGRSCWAGHLGYCRRKLTIVHISCTCVGARQYMTQVCDDGFVIAFGLSVCLRKICGGREVFHSRNVHNVSNSLLTDSGQLSVRRKAGIPYGTT